MKLGIIGMPNSGKTALFNSLTRSGAKSGISPFSTKESNVGAVSVPDPRLYELAKMYKSVKIVHASIEFMDIAGLVKGSGKGEGLGNKFLDGIRQSDALVHVVRCFQDDNVIHVDGTVNPARDIETVDFELIFADLEQLERRYLKQQKAAKADKSVYAELASLERLTAELEAGKPVRSLELSKDEGALVSMLGLLTGKPVIYALNVDEDATGSFIAGDVHLGIPSDAEVFQISAKLEEEMAAFDDGERAAMMADLGIAESGLDRIITASYKKLGLMSFLTAGPKAARAWTIPMNTKAPAAAGKIHSDIERGFIRAETVNYNDLMERGTYAAAKEAGLVRLEGKEYIVKEGDVILFRFNV
ncbi:MAG: redox-regulated ATPase YchF [Defluviitaleaceae bacterium]|nr:redox-regulated ATPase YchF [Defluviitaleaceae bacterium]MCL2836518.1 redox-regulated ATPase YchF [Defluviitaleaceae bacterium]